MLALVVRRVLMGNVGRQDNEVSKVCLVQKEKMVLLVQPDGPGVMDKRGLLVLKVLLVIVGCLVSKETPGPVVSTDMMVVTVRPVLKALLVSVGCLVSKEKPGLVVSTDVMVVTAQKV